MNPYEWIVANVSLLLYRAATLTFLVAWVFYSYRRLYRWGVSIKSSAPRWDNLLLPPDDLTTDIVGFLLVVAANLFLTGLLFHLLA